MKFIQPSELGNTYKFSLVSLLDQLIRTGINGFKRAVSNLVILFVITRVEMMVFGIIYNYLIYLCYIYN